MECGFSLGCFGSGVHQLVADFERELVVFRERDPAQCYPMPRRRTDLRVVQLLLDGGKRVSAQPLPHAGKGFARKGGHFERSYEIIEYMDRDDYGFVIGGKFANALEGHEHKLGIVPVTVTPAMKTPGATMCSGQRTSTSS